MDQGTCEECGESFTRTHPLRRFCTERCQRKAEAKRYRAKHTEQAECKQCGKTFTRNATTNRKKLNCSEECRQNYKADLFAGVNVGGRTTSCPHGTNNAATCPACTFLTRALDTQRSIRQVVRADPCAYCGCRPSGLDHIDYTNGGGADDWTNWSGCCQRCNSIKGSLSMLQALLFIPVNREYHDLRRSLFG